MSCETCNQDKTNCKCENNATSSKPFIQPSIKPPDLFVDKNDLAQYERKLKRWSRVCGVPPDQQGDIILIHPSLTNPSLHDRLDRELGNSQSYCYFRRVGMTQSCLI